jgi:hypothetical protein
MNKVKLNVKQVLNLVSNRGGWRQIYNSYPRMAQAVEKSDATIGKNSQQVPCPFTGNGSTKFRLFSDWEECGSGFHNDHGAIHGGISMIMQLEYCNCSRALEIITDLCGGADISMKTDAKYQVKSPVAKGKAPLSIEEKKKLSVKIERVFKSAIPASTSEVIAKHLTSYGLKGSVAKLPICLGYADTLYYGDRNGIMQTLCGLLGIMSDRDGKQVTIHRHYLDKATGRKADVLVQKQLMTSPVDVRGCSIKLDSEFNYGVDKDGKECSVIGYCEGLNTALAIREATGCPMEACYSADLLAMMEPKANITDVLIWADKDKSVTGERCANALKEKLEAKGIRVRVFYPERELKEGENSVDWLDVYQEQGPAGFPLHFTSTNVDTGFDYLTAIVEPQRLVM